MIVSGRVIDNKKNAAIQNAVVTVVNSDGSATGITTTTNEVGYFFINSPSITLESKFAASHPNYFTSEYVPVTGAVSYGFIKLEIKPVVVEEAPRPADPPVTDTGNNYSWLWLLALAALVYEATKKPAQRNRR